METITSADGTTIAFDRTGSWPPLVLVDGSTVDHTTWVDVLPLLEAQFRCTRWIVADGARAVTRRTTHSNGKPRT